MTKEKLAKNSIFTKSDMWKTFVRSNFLQSNLNYERMQALGAYYAMVPTLKRIYKDRPKEERVAAIRRHMEFFNTNPYVFSPIVGMTMAMEEATKENEKTSIVSVKTGLMGPLAGLGDSLLAMTIVPIIMSLAAGFSISGNILGPIFFIVLFSLVIWPIKYKGLQLGYEKGASLLSGANGNKLLQRISTMGNVVGMMVVGSLIVSSVKMVTPIQYSVGKSTIKIQSMLDGIMPNMLPFLITLIVYWLLKKKNASNAVLIIVVIMVLAILLTLFGVLKVA
ncbi:MAG: PTS system mannose/fructose/sorbose family transporter subunit IID [Sporolactobacillus sp.]